MPRLAIITTHPIQYNAPFFKALANSKHVQTKVFYTWGEGCLVKHDPGFGKSIEWDIPLLEGYDFSFVKNISRKPGSHSFFGIDNPTIIDDVISWKADAILIYGWNYKSHLKLMWFFKGRIPIYFRGDSTLIDEVSGFKKIIRRLFLKAIFRLIDFALFVGKNNKDYFSIHGIDDNHLIFMPHCIDNSFFIDNDKRKYSEEARKWKIELGFKPEERVILFAGKLIKKKNPRLLIDSIIKYNNEENNPLYLLIVGSGLLEEEIKIISKENKFIKFLPFQNQTKMPILYRICDLYCLPSDGPGETWGLAVNEAMVCSLPVLISDKVGCGSDLVKEGYNGFIFKSASLNKLYDIIKKLAKYDLREMGRNSSIVISEWTIAKAVAILEKSLLENKR